MEGYEIYQDEFKTIKDFKLFLKDKIHYEGCPRACNECEEPMADGYTTEGGDFYCCSDKCLYKMMSTDWKLPINVVKKMHSLYVAFDNDDIDEINEETYDMFGEVYYTEWYDSGHFWEE
tara:strand:- start:302 stop:658 length:357 start_codon:yes stop_codon:yes gene_type:complete